MINQIKNKAIQIIFSKLKYLFPNNKSANTILVNSFPKSGTHLLYQLFWKFNFINDYKTFIASHPSRNRSELNFDVIDKLISKTLKGELIRGHIFYNESTSNMINSKNIINFFIYRDPRDIVISESIYLYKMI